jgi:predicted DCC family thiol-disulfide oxidoreductase YuxK
MEYQNLILFDGFCNFCSDAVQWLVSIDHQRIFRFAPIQSRLGRELYARHGLDPENVQTLMLVDGQSVLTKSDAVLAILAKLHWPLISSAKWLPKSLGDRAYDEFAARRFTIFGRRDTCLVPTPELLDRFLDSPLGSQQDPDRSAFTPLEG